VICADSKRVASPLWNRVNWMDKVLVNLDSHRGLLEAVWCCAPKNYWCLLNETSTSKPLITEYAAVSDGIEPV
jgi:hypothetical protein